MGFNNHGAGELALRLTRHTGGVPIGVNIGKTRSPHPVGGRFYRASARCWPLAAYLVVNVSSPNTRACVIFRRSNRFAADPGRRPGRNLHRCW